MKRLALLIYLIFLSACLFGQSGGISWVDWDEAYIKAEEEQKILLVDLITFKCPYCVKMDKETYTDPMVIKILNKDFICTRVNPKREGVNYTIGEKVLNGQELIRYLTSSSMYSENPKVKFPTTVFILPINKQIFIEPGFQQPQVFKYMLFNCVKAKERVEKRLNKARK
ncbi:MAG: DUF255 domain-containing protein [Bacteroidetes bacterium]|nr:DUF255 domain-containing protein [Bacteroidota bacterium]